MNIIEKNLKERISQFKINWEMDPFPHAIIDNFLPPEIFTKIINGLSHVDSFQDVKKKFQSHVEFNKNVYGDSDLNELAKLPIDILGGSNVKEIFRKFLNGQKLISLCDWPDYGGYYPFHSMITGGVLGAHVDHSHSRDGDLHVANSIFYVSPKWKESWGGETILFNHIGTKAMKKVVPAPNRLILFIHSSSSFHGVNTIFSPAGVQRSTYYMDYYIHEKELSHVYKALKNKGCKNLVYSFHGTSFVPFFPLGVKSFKIKFIFMKSTYPYLGAFLKYMIVRFLLNNRLGRSLRKIKYMFKKKTAN